jgi:hypothetical protein
MKYARIVVAVLVSVFFVLSLGQAENKFVGAKKCGMCHKAKEKGEAYTIWEKSKHASAFKTLQGEEAIKIGKEKKLAKAPAESPECLKCHVTGGGEAKNVDASWKKEEGVTCEACHGAASAFMMIHNKPENAAKAAAAGLITGDAAKKTCETCHNSNSPTFKGFKYEEMWAKIAHKLPAKN